LNKTLGAGENKKNEDLGEKMRKGKGNWSKLQSPSRHNFIKVIINLKGGGGDRNVQYLPSFFAN